MFVIMFGVGIGFVILSLIIGELDGVEGTMISFFKPTLIAVFLTVTGGIGLLLTPILGSATWLILLISAIGGVMVSGLLNKLVLVPLYRAQNTSAFNVQDTIGKQAEVIAVIPQGGYGKIKYNISGSVVTAPAKSENGAEIRAGETVSIIYIDDKTYYVRPA